MSYNGEDFKSIQKAIHNFVAEMGLFPTITDIDERVDISKATIRDILKKLVSQGNLKSILSERKGIPKAFLPTDMYNAVINKQPKPEWIDEYSFEKKFKLEEDIQQKRELINKYHRIESLLFATGGNLEDALCEAFMLLELENLECCYDDPEKWDFSFELDGEIYVCDAKGVTQSAKKSDAGQLDQWFHDYLDQHDPDPEKLKGLLIINHFRNHDPKDRWPTKKENPPLTEKGEKYLRVGNSKFFITTLKIYGIVKEVLVSNINEEEARNKLKDNLNQKTII